MTAMEGQSGPNQEALDHAGVRDYYDGVYHKYADVEARIPNHYRRLAKRFVPWWGKRLLDVGCGTGLWLRAVAELGAVTAGNDISQAAIDICKRSLPQAQLHCGPAEHLPFADRQFDFVSCLGALEHFLNPDAALREMSRVAKAEAGFLFLVPNADFLPRRWGLYSGTQQVAVHEQVRKLAEWQELFESAGFRIEARWKDLHVLTPSWIVNGSWYSWPLRAAQALALPCWPLCWQYQVYHQCRLR